jgi:hypothetical protein
MTPMRTYHTLVLVMYLVLVFLVIITVALVKENASLSYRVESLEYRLYDLNQKEFTHCFGAAMENYSACYDKTTEIAAECPEIKACNAKFTENEQWYKDW